MKIYEQILNNKDYLELVSRIEEIKFITDGKWDWEHGLSHYKRVADYAERILGQLNADERMIDLGMTAAALHDIGLAESGIEKIDHGVKGSKTFRKFIADTDITKEEESIIEHAIADHSRGNNINSLVGLALVLADKLDVTYHRTENSSIQDEMNKEIQKIRKVDIEITDKELMVKYVVDGELNLRYIEKLGKSNNNTTENCKAPE
jgi:HD superfamily phosphodiesterase